MMKTSLCAGLGVLIGTTALTLSVSAQRAPQPLSVTVSQIKPNIYWAAGGGGNSGIIIGDNGVIVVDAKSTAEGAKLLLAEIAKLTPKPVTHVFVTHSDADHWGGLDAFAPNTTVIASEGFRKEQMAIIAMNDAPNQRVPSRLVKQGRETMTVDGVKLEAIHWVPGHTSGDLLVYLPDQRIVFTGDVTSNARPEPTLHAHKGATADGWIATVGKIVALDADLFVSGHGDADAFTRAWLEQRLKSATETRDRVVALVKEGRSLGDIKMALKSAPPPASGNPTYVEVAYWNALLRGKK
jgi:glyoxylase-like metal-dependent hydrolase (beta-lactamase superfamily II)